MADFHASTGRVTHMLNNLLTALYCQWDFCYPEGGADPPEGVAALKRTFDLVAAEIRELSRNCADYSPAAEAVRRRGDPAKR